jgi:3-oxoadipate enol-lactonase
VLATIAELGVERAAIVGNSFGGTVALRIAVVAPSVVSALALISSRPPGLDASAGLTAAMQAGDAELARGDRDAAIAAVVDAWTLVDATPKLRERVAAMQRRAFERQAGIDEVTDALDPIADLAILGQIEVPTLVAWGEHDLPDFERAAYTISRAMPHARRELIGGAGHLAPLETPERFRELLLAFLEEVGGEG